MRIKRILLGGAIVLGACATALGVYAGVSTAAYDASLDKVYDVPPLPIVRSTDPAVLERGKHVVETTGGCVAAECHGSDLGGGKTVVLGPLGRFTGPNISAGGLGAAYTDGELARIIRHGIKRDGRSVRFMPVPDFNWLSDGDVTAAVSYIRTMPAVDRDNGPTEFTALGKVLDRRDAVKLDIARRVDHGAFHPPPEPTPDAEYGAYLARGCTGCHGDHLSGGPIPGAPSTLAVPLDLTPQAPEGLGGWSFADFDRAISQGMRPDGRKLDPFMPSQAYGKLDDTEKHALWAYLQGIPARPFGGR